MSNLTGTTNRELRVQFTDERPSHEFVVKGEHTSNLFCGDAPYSAHLFDGWRLPCSVKDGRRRFFWPIQTQHRNEFRLRSR
jgi:hypothetical protein